MANGAVVWRGPSVLTGDPIVVIATGIRRPSANAKTGDMIQIWILREDVHPSEAAYGQGMADGAICGVGENRCPFAKLPNGKRECYVKVFNAPRSVYAALQAGAYQPLDLSVLSGRYVRLGAYGDPAAVPFEVWEPIVTVASGHTAYTHQWRTCDPRFATIAMASVESADDLDQAEAAGWRVFYVGDRIDRSLIHCPASKERGKRLQCADCRACSGADPKRRSVWIRQHS